MSYATTAAPICLGLLFAGFGLNGFLNLKRANSPWLADQLVASDPGSRYSYIIFGVQLLSGVLLLSSFCVPFALVVLASEIVKFFNYHLTVERKGLAAVVGEVVLWIIVAYPYRAALFALFTSDPQQLP